MGAGVAGGGAGGARARPGRGALAGPPPQPPPRPLPPFTGLFVFSPPPHSIHPVWLTSSVSIHPISAHPSFPPTIWRGRGSLTARDRPAGWAGSAGGGGGVRGAKGLTAAAAAGPGPGPRGGGGSQRESNGGKGGQGRPQAQPAQPSPAPSLCSFLTHHGTYVAGGCLGSMTTVSLSGHVRKYRPSRRELLCSDLV